MIVWWFQPLFICSLWSKLQELPAMPSCDWLSSPFWCSRWHAEIKIGGVMVYVHSFRTTIHSSDGCFQQNKVPYNKHNNRTDCLNMWVSGLSLDLNLIEHRAPFGIWWSWRVTSRICSKKCTRFDTKKNPERDLSFTVTKHSEAENQRKVTERNYWEFFFFFRFFGCLSRLHFHGNSLPEIWPS